MIADIVLAYNFSEFPRSLSYFDIWRVILTAMMQAAIQNIIDC